MAASIAMGNKTFVGHLEVLAAAQATALVFKYKRCLLHNKLSSESKCFDMFYIFFVKQPKYWRPATLSENFPKSLKELSCRNHAMKTLWASLIQTKLLGVNC